MVDEVIFNGYALSDFFDVIHVGRPLSGRVNTTESVSGMDGVRLTGSSMGSVLIGVTVMLSNMSIRQRRERVRELSLMLHTDSLARLEFGSDGGLYYMAVLDGEVPVTEHVRSDLVTFNFAAESPIMYGAERYATIPSGGTATIYVGGTYPTEPTISGTVTANNDGLWGVRLDSEDTIRVPVTGSKALVIDCTKRTATVAGALVLPTLDSDWLSMGAGTHTLQNDVGTGASTVRWVERWR